MDNKKTKRRLIVGIVLTSLLLVCLIIFIPVATRIIGEERAFELRGVFALILYPLFVFFGFLDIVLVMKFGKMHYIDDKSNKK